MKTKLPILSVVSIVLGLLAVLTVTGSSQNNVNHSKKTTWGHSSDSDATLLMSAVVAAMERHGSISAKIRQRVDLFGHRLVGKGTYFQSGHGLGKLLRWELTLQTSATNQAILQQVCDGRYVWVFENFSGKPTLSRIDIRDVRIALEQHDAPVAIGSEVFIGGIPKLLAALRDNFDFTSVKETQLNHEPVWQLEGSWKRSKLAKLLPKQKNAILAGKPVDLRKLPPHLPDRVVLYVSRDQQLLPYKIEYRRATGKDQATDADPSQQEIRPVVIMEMYEVKLNEKLDPHQFDYKPESLEITDRTEAYLKSLGLKRDQEKLGKAKRKKSSTSR